MQCIPFSFFLQYIQGKAREIPQVTYAYLSAILLAVQAPNLPWKNKCDSIIQIEAKLF